MFKKFRAYCGDYVAALAFVGFIAMILACSSTKDIVRDDINNAAYGDRAQVVDSIDSEAMYDVAMN